MKPFLIHGILILLLNTTVYSADLHAIWTYEDDTYIDGFALYEVVDTNPDPEIEELNYIPVDVNIPKTEREFFWNTILIGKECKKYALAAWWEISEDIVFSNYARAPGCAKPGAPLTFIVE